MLITRVGLLTLVIVACQFDTTRAPALDSAVQDSVTYDSAAGAHDASAPLDSIPVDAVTPNDAFACQDHSMCAAMSPGTCCVNPGPTGYCKIGVVIGGVCN